MRHTVSTGGVLRRKGAWTRHGRFGYVRRGKGLRPLSAQSTGRKGMNEMHISMAEENIAAAVLDVYAPYIEKTAITFETAVPDEAAFAARMGSIRRNYPYLVCEAGGKVLGYAYAAMHKERAAYQWGLELSIYVREGFTGRKIGSALYTALTGMLRLQGICNVYGCVTLPNKPSEALLRAFGFTLLGVFHKTGYKCGMWHDVGWYEAFIGTHEPNPAPPLPVDALAPEQIAAMLRAGERVLAAPV